MIKRGTFTSTQKAMTLVELLTAMAITLIFLSSVVLAFIQIIRASEDVQATVDAHASARSAVDQVTRDLRQLNLDVDPDYQQFILINRNLTYGDHVDNDQDGFIDEELYDGLDQDGDAVDQHPIFGGFTERPNFVGVADYGDLKVDEDCLFSADEVSFIIPAEVGNPLGKRLRVTYRLGTFEGEDHVLLRVITVDPSVSGTGDVQVVEPVIFEAVSFDVMGWNPNSNWSGPVPDTAYWTQSWDARLINAPYVRPLNAGDDPNAMPFKFPAAFMVSLVVNAERAPLNEIGDWPYGGAELDTVRMTTVIGVEQVLTSSDYDEYVRD